LNVTVGFDCVDEESNKRVRMGYKINDEKRKYKYFKYEKCGIQKVKLKMSEFINKIRVENKLSSGNIVWDGLKFEYQ